MRPARLSRLLHKWLALFVGVQALAWIVSGFYMVVVDLDFIHGDTLVRNLATAPPAAASLHPLEQIRASYAGLERARIKGLPGFSRPLYELKTRDAIVLLDATNGSVMSPLSRATIEDLARRYFAGDARIAGSELLKGAPPLEIQARSLPLWRIQFDDWHETTLYIHPDSGELVTRRHRSWRWFDAFWMLHIMDYGSRTDVNNAALRVATIAGLVFLASGGWLLWFSFRRGQGVGTRSSMRFMRLVHKWFSLLVGLQLLLWMVSGLAFAWLEHDAVTAHNSLRQPGAPVLDSAVAVLEPADLLARLGRTSPLDVTLLPLATEWVYRVRFAERVELRRASDGAPFAITEPLVRALANARYAGSGSQRQVVLRQPPVLEARDAGAVWEASYGDPARTALYFSASDGAFIAARNDSWRLFDVFWMLHTMDFDGRDDFNNPLVILFSTGALWVALTGALLLLQVFGVNAKLKSGLGSGRRSGRD